MLSLNFVEGTPPAVPSPTVPGLQIEYVGVSRQLTSDFKGQASYTVSHNFSVRTLQPGEFVIPSMAVEIAGQKLTSQPVKLQVLKANPPSTQDINSGSTLAFLKLTLPKKQMYLGETIVAQLDLFLHSSVRNIGNFQTPTFPFEGCNVGKMIQGNQRRAQVGNTIYTVIPLSLPVKPIRVGTLNLGSVTASFVAQIASARQPRDFFDQFGLFGSGEQRQVTVVTEPTTLQCLPLPKENVPANFNGAVGSFTMNATAGPTNVAAGDPITVRVQLAGRGALDALTLPELSLNDFKVYPPTVKATEPTDAFGLQGSKTFEQVIVPQNADIKELPPISFSFFDPEQGSYRTLAQPAVQLLVRPGAASPQPTVAVANRGTEQGAPSATQDIVPIKTSLGTVAQISPPLLMQPWFLALQSVPVLALISVVVWRKREEKLANNPRLRRQRQVAQIIREGLNDLQRLAAEKKSDEFFAVLFRLLQEQLGERLDLPAFAITEAVIDEHLKSRKVSEAVLTPLHELFQACNLARYAPIRSSQELAALVPRLEATLRDLQSLKL